MNWNLVGSIYGRSSLKSAYIVMIHYQTWPPQAILVSDWPIFYNLLLWNRLAKLTKTWYEASMECPLWILLISSQSVNKHGYHRNLVGSIYGMSSMKIAHFVRSVSKHGHHMQFLFLISRFLKNLLLWNCLAIWTETL